ncbi:GDSL-type esterase/lipase family protein [Heliophilum fasciatum]|uniref:Lysophospholipase L1-like esterase n=1 Tax=Heliophilum fasciatum TaxID=35700 RepID=A0A4R2RW96_9FIRM|nr:GDSL-type esterase/lipase family protein [Heliophilum fasciatum]MCW2276817.1 lysophospholipase L1-like esterase [Heliophilum fasciatum]TCP68722.1 lysophospholipase L1-like esterase [Heliophilum fasciatum]
MEQPMIFALGDSLTWGYPEGPDYSWTTILEEALQCPVINLGTNGATTEDMRREMIHILPDVEPRSIVVITGGANDAFQLVPAEKVIRNYRDMLERVRIARCQAVIGLTIPINEEPFGARLLGYRQAMLTALREDPEFIGIPVIDFFAALAVDDGWTMKPEYAVDSCHPSREGYRKMGEAAVAFFRQETKKDEQ